MIGRSVIPIILFFVLLQSSAFAETIYYTITQMGLKAGEASLSMAGATSYKGKSTVLIVFKADGLNFFDEENIYVDPDSYQPLFVERNLNIFGSKEKILEDYSVSGEIRITKTAGEKTTQQVLTKIGITDNIYAFIYRYRKQGSFQMGDTLDVNLPTKDLKIEMVKRTPIDAGGKRYDSFFMQSKPAKYKLWFDASEKKLPLRISGAIGFANTAMVMKNYED